MTTEEREKKLEQMMDNGKGMHIIIMWQKLRGLPSGSHSPLPMPTMIRDLAESHWGDELLFGGDAS